MIDLIAPAPAVAVNTAVGASPVQIHAVKQIGTVIVIGQRIKVFRQNKGLFSSPQKSAANGLGDM